MFNNEIRPPLRAVTVRFEPRGEQDSCDGRQGMAHAVAITLAGLARSPIETSQTVPMLEPHGQERAGSAVRWDHGKPAIALAAPVSSRMCSPVLARSTK